MAPTVAYCEYRGLGEMILLFMEHLQVKYEVKRYPIGPAPDYDRSEWLNEKFHLGLEFPNLPYFIDGEQA